MQADCLGVNDRPETLHLIVKALLIATLLAVLLLIAAQLVGLLVLAFGAVVIAVLLETLASWVSRHSPLSGRWSLTAVLLAIAAILAGGGWLFGATISSQFAQLAEILPPALDAVRRQVEAIPGGKQMIAAMQEAPVSGEFVSQATDIVRSLATAVGDVVLIVFGAIFIAANPGLYRAGVVKLVPPSKRDLVDQALGDTGTTLRKWMLGQLVSMALVGLLTGLGLWLVGVPSAAALALIAGLFEIVPWAGPILAAVPIMIIALAQGPETGLLALGVVLMVQQIESNLILPYVQKKAVSLPPALTVFGVVAGGLLFGFMGVIFAAPLLVVAYTLVKRLYVEAVLGTPARIPGREDGSE